MSDTPAYEAILVEREGPALIITFNRPDRRNALSLQLMDEVAAAVDIAAADTSVRAIIFTGGEKFFSAGADLNEALQVETVADGDAFFGRANRLNAKLESCPKPVLAAIEGFCMTGGLELAMACDIRIGARGSSYAITSARIGTVAGFGGTQRLPRLIGPGRAMDMLFAANPIETEDAYRMGLIDRMPEQGSALNEAKMMTAVYAERGPISLAYAKRAVRTGMQTDLTSAIDLEFALVTSIYSTDDKREGISAFLDKRKADFNGC